MKRAIVIGLVMAMLFSTEAYGAGLNSGKNQPAVIEIAAAAEEPEAAQGETAEEKSRDLTEEEKSRDLTEEEKSRDLTEDEESRDQTAVEKSENQTAEEKSGDQTEARPPVGGVEIPVTEIEPIMIGQAENKEAGTGCTVLVCKDGMKAGLDVRGGGPASRESQLLNPLTSAQYIHAVVLSGGSAYGLGTANGVMSYLEEQGIGYDTGVALVPLVAQSDIFDLSVGDGKVRPDADMGYQAVKSAFEEPNYQDGNFGAGCGASVGKIAGMDYAMKTGIGSYAVQIGELKIGAVVVLNALGDVYDWKTGEQVAGLLTEDKTGLRSTMDYMCSSIGSRDNKFTGNTTLAVVVTNADFSKPQLCKIAGMAHNGFARSINPVHTSADGDSIYAVSVGNVNADQDLVGSLAAEVISEALLRSVYSAESAYGLPAAADLGKNSQ